MGKKLAYVTVKVDDDEKAIIAQRAAEARVTVSEYVRRQALGDAPPRGGGVPAASPLPVHQLDELGPDSLWAGDRALAR